MRIIPEPISIDLKDGEGCKVGKNIVYNQEGITESVFADFKAFLSNISLSDDSLDINATVSTKMAIDEYKMVVSKQKIVIAGGSASGVFYGLQSLKQLVIEYKGNIPAVVIKDKPKYGYRAFMLDVGRYFYPVDEVKRYIDLMAVHKLNHFHWHLNEDQGWRIEIKKYPNLTVVGSRRTHTNFNYFHPQSGYYTQEEIKDIVKYCHDRFIKVAPEFDIPGHCVSAIASYPHLGCFPDRKIKVATHWGVKHDILCVGKESTYQFVRDVIDEMIELFPDEYFHIGGDEAVKTRWKICPDCQAKIAQLGLKNEEELQQVFMSDIHKYLEKKGKKSMMWNWDLADNVDNLDVNIIWQYCGEINEDKACEAINNGRNIVLSTCFANYLDFPYGWANLEKSYKNPTCTSKILSENTGRVLGVEAPLWTEYVPGRRRADYLTFPRLGAIAENAWSSEDTINYEKFLDKLAVYFQVLDVYGVKYAKEARYAPNKLLAFGQSLWFNRRQLHWQGLHNLIDNAKVKAKYGKKK